jgi:hypothetical protein
MANRDQGATTWLEARRKNEQQHKRNKIEEEEEEEEMLNKVYELKEIYKRQITCAVWHVSRLIIWRSYRPSGRR